MYFLITISIANPAIQLLTQNVNKEACLKPSRTSTMELICKKAPSQMFDWALNIALNRLLMAQPSY